MAYVLLGVLAVVGSLGGTAAILVGVFAAIRRGIDRDAAVLQGIELDSGTTKIVTRFDQFRSERLIRGGYRRNYGRAVLTSTHLHIIERPQRYGIFERADLARFSVGSVDGSLVLCSTDPPEATGTITYEIPLSDPTPWIAALRRAGATPLQ